MSKYTPWFPPDIKPMREGLYQATAAFPHETALMYFFRDGKWFVTTTGFPSLLQSKNWRGLARKP